MKKLFLLSVLTCTTVMECLSKQLPELTLQDSIGLLLEFAKARMDLNPNDAALLAQRAYRYAHETESIPEQADASFVLGKAYAKLHHAAKAITAFEQAAVLFQQEKQSIKEGNSYHGLANVYIYELNNFTKGFQYCKKAHSLLKSDSAALQPVLGNLAALFLQTKKTDQALALFNHIYTYWQKRNKLPGMANALNNIATVYEEKHDYRNSILYYEKAISIYQSLKAYPNLGNTLLGLANANCQINEHSKSEQLLSEVLSLAQLHAMTTLTIQAFQFLAEEQMHRGHPQEALRYAVKAHDLSNKKGITVFNLSQFEQLSKLYKANGDLAHAFEYQQKLIAWRDSAQLNERIALAEAVDPSGAAQSENDVFSKSETILFTILGLGMVGIAMYYIYRKRIQLSPDNDLSNSENSIQEFNQKNDTISPTEPITSLPSIPVTAPKLEVIHGEGVKLLPLHAVWWFQKEGKSYRAFTESDNYRVKQNISELEEALPKGKFFRVNRVAIINTSYMSNYSFWENHKYIIRMRDHKKSSFTISRNRLRELKDALQQLPEN